MDPSPPESRERSRPRAAEMVTIVATVLGSPGVSAGISRGKGGGTAPVGHASWMARAHSTAISGCTLDHIAARRTLLRVVGGGVGGDSSGRGLGTGGGTLPPGRLVGADSAQEYKRWGGATLHVAPVDQPIRRVQMEGGEAWRRSQLPTRHKTSSIIDPR